MFLIDTHMVFQLTDQVDDYLVYLMMQFLQMIV